VSLARPLKGKGINHPKLVASIGIKWDCRRKGGDCPGAEENDSPPRAGVRKEVSRPLKKKSRLTQTRDPKETLGCAIKVLREVQPGSVGQTLGCKRQRRALKIDWGRSLENKAGRSRAGKTYVCHMKRIREPQKTNSTCNW